MKIAQSRWTPEQQWVTATANHAAIAAKLVLVFGDRLLFNQQAIFTEIRDRYPEAYILGCSTAGEIYDTEVTDNALTITAVEFEHTRIQPVWVAIAADESSEAAGQKLAAQLETAGLVHVFVLSEGINVNGSALVAGLLSGLPPQVTVTGGLSGDGARFEQTLVLRDGVPTANGAIALGFYGEKLQVGFGSWGGWTPFGPERVVTHAQGNVLYKLDGQSALALYRTYLGEDYAQGLPSTGLLFPLCLRHADDKPGVVRTILGIDEAEQSLTFAGDVPEGSRVQLMKANFDRLVDGAGEAAEISFRAHGETSPELAILISCVGRKLVLKQRIEEEVEIVRDILGEQTALTGFYSYGEIAPFESGVRCELHNQTMTITTLREMV